MSDGSKLFTFVVLSTCSMVLQAADRPNVLWVTAEDMSPTVGCYGDTFATTPHLDALARQSVRYTHAFATAPVCSPSRSCLINGLAAPSQGTHNMRSAFSIPGEMTGFPSILRKLGYYTSNNVKTDYNSGNWKQIIAASWDDSSDTAHWQRRKRAQPFFSVFNLMTSHQSRTMVWPYEQFKAEVQSRLTADEIHDPATVPVPPYYPDTPIVRRTMARYYDCVTAMDKEVGTILKELEDDGLADDTIVFFYSDHGSGMPRHKRALLDSGMRVALMIRFPKKYGHRAPSEPGTTTDRLVSFDDYAPTVLSLVGAKVPKYMRGKPFLGTAKAEPRRYVYGHRDRVDEVIDMARSIRDKRYLYIRNYMPHLGYNQPTAWPDLSEIRHEFYRLAERATMTDAQWQFAGPTRPVEELYDCEADPQNLTNLAGSVEHRAVRNRLRRALEDHLLASRDLGFLPEAETHERCGDQTLPMQLARKDETYNLPKLIDAASLVGTGTETQLMANLTDEDSAIRYWSAVGFSGTPDLSPTAVVALKAALDDTSANVRIETANALARHGHVDKALPVLAEALEDTSLASVLHAARTVELLGEKARPLVPAMQRTEARLKGIRPKDMPATVVLPGDVDTAMFIGFSTSAFLQRFAASRAVTN